MSLADAPELIETGPKDSLEVVASLPEGRTQTFLTCEAKHESGKCVQERMSLLADGRQRVVFQGLALGAWKLTVTADRNALDPVSRYTYVWADELVIN
jgi:hypothetical protein